MIESNKGCTPIFLYEDPINTGQAFIECFSESRIFLNAIFSFEDGIGYYLRYISAIYSS